MSTAVISTKKCRARINHRCAFCSGEIRTGDQYGRWVTAGDGKAATVKLCDLCAEFAEEFTHSRGRDEFTRDDAIDWAIDFYGPDDAAFWFLVRIGWWGE